MMPIVTPCLKARLYLGWGVTQSEKKTINCHKVNVSKKLFHNQTTQWGPKSTVVHNYLCKGTPFFARTTVAHPREKQRKRGRGILRRQSWCSADELHHISAAACEADLEHRRRRKSSLTWGDPWSATVTPINKLSLLYVANSLAFC